MRLDSMKEIGCRWRAAIYGLWSAERALRELECTNQANAVADMLDAALEAYEAICNQQKRLEELEAAIMAQSLELDIV